MKKLCMLFLVMCCFMLSACTPKDINSFLESVRAENRNFTFTVNKDVTKIDGDKIYRYNAILGSDVATEYYYSIEGSFTYRYYINLSSEWNKDQVLTTDVSPEDDFKGLVESDFTLKDGVYVLSTSKALLLAHGKMEITFSGSTVVVETLLSTTTYSDFGKTNVSLPKVA